MNGSYVLENKLGQVVRTFQWKNRGLTLVFREDTKRIVPVDSTKDLDDQGIKYGVIAKVDKEDVRRKPVAIGSLGFLKWIPEIESVSPTVELPQDNPEDFKKSLKWVAGIQVAMLLLALLIGYFIPGAPPKEEPQVVRFVPKQIAPRQRIVVQPSEKKIKRQVIAKGKKKINPRVARKIPNFKRVKTSQRSVAINHLGALGALGSMTGKTSRHGGLNLNAIKTSRGPGLGGGTQGSGGMQTNLYAKGIIAAPVGPGANPMGAGGYGTRGKGGGQAGYGKHSLVGSSTAYFQPVESEASVEGGLDRDQIAAVIQRHLGQVRFCYEQGLQIQPALAGKVAVKFFINGRGVVDTAHVSRTSLNSNNVEGCILTRLRSWKFPEPKGGVTVKVNYPFILKRISQG
jgi:hypothetical protein